MGIKDKSPIFPYLADVPMLTLNISMLTKIQILIAVCTTLLYANHSSVISTLMAIYAVHLLVYVCLEVFFKKCSEI